MKKIIALMLIVSCMLVLGSCKIFNKGNGTQDENDNNQTPVVIDTEAVAAIQAKIDASAPTSAEITVTLNSVLGDLVGEYNVAYNQDGSATVDYTYEKFNSFDEANLSGEYKTVIPGTVTIAADGTVTDSIGGTAAVEAVTFSINLDTSKLASASVSGGTLIAKVKAVDTAAVLGVSIGADVDLAVSVGTSGVTSVSISYTTQSGPVTISAIYDYYVEVADDTVEGGEEAAE